MKRPTVLLAGLALLAGVLPAAAGARPLPNRGCVGARPATVFTARGRVPGGRAHARTCGVTTGYAAAESHILALPDGTVVFSPAVLPHGLAGTGTAALPIDSATQSNASPAGLAVTRDGGRHWLLAEPSGVTWNPTDHGDYVDPATGRVFFEDYGPIPPVAAFGTDQEGPAHINTSDDLLHWHHTVIAGLFLPENPHFTAAAPPAAQPRPHGYPDVVYFCANTNVGFTSPLIAGRLCFDSLDGGQSWTQRSLLFSATVPRHAQCGGAPEQFSAIDGYYPQPAPDGSLYVMVACGGRTYLARSTDEAASFPILTSGGRPLVLPVPTPGAGSVALTPQLRIGRHGVFVLVYQQGQRLLERASADRGRSWTRPESMTAPGVGTVGEWAVALAGDALAVSYLGARAGQSTFDGYLSATRDVTAALRPGDGPVFAAGRVNPANRPLLYGQTVQGSGYVGAPGGAEVPLPPPLSNQSTGNDFIGAAVRPDGTAWGSFTQDCGPSPSSPSCRADGDQTRGFAGVLRWD